MPSYTLKQLAEHVQGRVHGDPNLEIHSVSTLELGKEGQISFLANPKYARKLDESRVGAVVVKEELDIKTPQVIAEDPYYAFTQIAIYLHGHRRHPQTGISGKASIARTATVGPDCQVHDFVTVSENARIGRGCVLYPGVFVGPGTEIGDECILYPNAVVYDDCRLGHRVILQANATVGEDGFGYATHKGVHHKIPHLGRVILEDDVEIGSGASIERGTLQDTIIGRGAKLGDLVAIGHGTQIGAGCLLVAQVGVAGSTSVGNYCVIAGQAGIVGHVKIGNQVTVGAQAGVAGNVPDGAKVLGSPAIDAHRAKQSLLLVGSLPEYRRRLRAMEKRIQELEDKLGAADGDRA